MKQEQPQEQRGKEAVSMYDNHRHFIGTYDIDGDTITETRLKRWAEDPGREFICIFCDSPPMEQNGFMWCRRCKEYKGIMPNC